MRCKKSSTLSAEKPSHYKITDGHKQDNVNSTHALSYKQYCGSRHGDLFTTKSSAADIKFSFTKSLTTL